MEKKLMVLTAAFALTAGLIFAQGMKVNAQEAGDTNSEMNEEMNNEETMNNEEMMNEEVNAEAETPDAASGATTAQ